MYSEVLWLQVLKLLFVMLNNVVRSGKENKQTTTISVTSYAVFLCQILLCNSSPNEDTAVFALFPHQLYSFCF